MAPVPPVPPVLKASDPSDRPQVRVVPLRVRKTRAPIVHFLVPALRWALALEFVGAAAMKLSGQPGTVALFAAVGFGQWFRYGVGCFELLGATLVVYPRTTVIGATALSALMVGAARTEIMILDRAPLSSGVTLAALITLAMLAGRQRNRTSSSLGLAKKEIVDERTGETMARDSHVEA